MIFIQPRRGIDVGTAARRVAAVEELLAETGAQQHASHADLDEATLLFLAVHPALSHDAQEVLLLRTGLWFERGEIARTTGLAPASVETRLRGAYRRLRSTGLGTPFTRAGLQSRTHRMLEILELLYWRADCLTSAHPALSQRLHQGVVSRSEVLAAQEGPVGAEANALLAFLALGRARMGDSEPGHERGRNHLRAAEHAGASGRYLWLARILAVYLGSTVPGSGTMDWRRVALMWEAIHEIDRPSAGRWLRNPAARLTVEGGTS